MSGIKSLALFWIAHENLFICAKLTSQTFCCPALCNNQTGLQLKKLSKEFLFINITTYVTFLANGFYLIAINFQNILRNSTGCAAVNQCVHLVSAYIWLGGSC